MRTYWMQTVQSRISRRRALAATSAGVLGAAFLAACGGSDKGDKKETSTDKSGLLGTPVDATSQAKAGGVLKVHNFLDPVQGLDPLGSNHRVTQNVATFSYSRLLQNSVEKYPKLAAQTAEGDIAESYEVSPDKLTLTLKLRQGIKWDARAPTSGRTLDAQDVLFSLNKFAKTHPNRSELMYDAQNAKAAPIEIVSSPDSRTIVLKLKAPDVSLLAMLSSDSYIYIMPREAETGFNAKTEMRGSGPYMLEEYAPSVRLTWRRNPDYYGKDRPYPDRIELPIISEYAQRLAQFRSGQIYNHIATQEDVVQTKKDVPETVMLQHAGYPAIGGMGLANFGYEGDSPWKDVRMRQALAMTTDYEGLIDALTNRDKFVSQGFPADAARHTILLPGWVGHWLDPANEKEFGPNAKFMSYNLPEAKKLMAAAGFADGVKFTLTSSAQHPPPTPRRVELWAGMFREAGFQVTQTPLPEAEHFRNYFSAYSIKEPDTGKAKGFNGVNSFLERSGPTVPSLMYASLHPDSGAYKGISPDGRNIDKGDPKINEMIDKMRVEFDVPKQQALAKDVQRQVAGQAYFLVNPGSVKPFQLVWPVIANAGVYSIFGATDPTPVAAGSSWREPCLTWWIDSTKAPLGRS